MSAMFEAIDSVVARVGVEDRDLVHKLIEDFQGEPEEILELDLRPEAHVGAFRDVEESVRFIADGSCLAEAGETLEGLCCDVSFIHHKGLVQVFDLKHELEKGMQKYVYNHCNCDNCYEAKD